MWSDTGFDAGLDMEAYINKRMLEIPNLQERELYKEIVGNMIRKIYEYAQSSYQELEQKILNECSSDRSNYAIYMTLTDIPLFFPRGRRHGRQTLLGKDLQPVGRRIPEGGLRGGKGRDLQHNRHHLQPHARQPAEYRRDFRQPLLRVRHR